MFCVNFVQYKSYELAVLRHLQIFLKQIVCDSDSYFFIQEHNTPYVLLFKAYKKYFRHGPYTMACAGPGRAAQPSKMQA